MTNQKAIDAPSILGQFGWEKLKEDFAIPVILRSDGVRYSAVRMVEQEIIKKFDALPQLVFQCITLKSFYLTSGEAKLLNNLNFNHCNNRYGENFFTTKDVIISAGDVKELSRFLNISNEVFTDGLARFEFKLGVVSIAIDPRDPTCKMLVPYVCKSYSESLGPVRFIPSKQIEPYVVISSSTVRAQPSDWDIMYLRMLCIYCNNNSQQFITRDSPIVLLNGLLYSKTNTPIIYEENRIH